jgi:hypothetical protein
MSEREKFLERWSRRKREIAEGAAPAAEPAVAPLPEEDKTKLVSGEDEGKQDASAAPANPKRTAAANDAPEFDPASLPPIESIVADTDIRDFLKPGVPAGLTRAALRRAWAADPAIRDFVGLAENAWDFTDPAAMPGFGPLDPAEVPDLVAQVFGKDLREKAETVLSEPSTVTDRSDSHATADADSAGETPAPEGSQQIEKTLVADATESASDPLPAAPDAAPQDKSEEPRHAVPIRRGHGGALPT